MQSIYDLTVGNGVQPLIYPQSLTASTQGTSFNAYNQSPTTNAIVTIGALTGTGASVEVFIEEYNGTSWSTIQNPAAGSTGMDTGAITTSDTQVVLLGLRQYGTSGSGAYVRANVKTVTGTALVSVSLVAGSRYAGGTGTPGLSYSTYPAGAV
jgi:hypothetical protein